MTDHILIDPPILYIGTPVVLLSTLNPDGTANLAPMSSVFALGQTVVLGMELTSRTAQNMRERREVVVNVPGPELWRNVESLARLTGSDPVPDEKRDVYSYCADKFTAAGLTAEASDRVGPPRVAECRLQIEAEVVAAEPDAGGVFLVTQTRARAIHADPALMVPGTQHIDAHKWRPLVLNFRHYFGLGEEVGENFKTPTPSNPAASQVK